MAVDPAAPFLWGSGGRRLTPEEILLGRKEAASLGQQAMSTAPVGHWSQGLNRVLQGLMSGYDDYSAGEASKQNASDSASVIQALLGGGAQPAAAAPVAAPVSAPMGATSIPAGTVDPSLSDAITTAATAHGVDPAYMTRLAMVENGGRVNGSSPLSSATGPFQFINSTAKQYGLTNPSDPAMAADAAARLTLDNKANLTQALGREPTPGELYLAHQQGSGGAAKLLANPEVPVESVIGAQAARNNGAVPGMTAGQFAQKWTGKFGDIVQTVDPGQKNVIDAQADMPPGAVDAAAIPPAAMPTQGALPTAPAPAAPARSAINPAVLQAITSPYMSEQARKIGGLLFQNQLTQQTQANDPLRQLQIKKAEQETSKPESEWKPIGRDANGAWQYGWVNSKTQEVKDRNGQPLQAQSQQPADDPTAGLSGNDYLGAIPRDRADIARKVAAGEIDVSSLPNRGNYRMQVLSDAARYDPSFNPSDYKTRLATRKDFTSGKSAQNITSFNTAIGHLDSLDRSIDKLGNRGSSWYNAATAPISEQTDPKYQVALKDFRTSKQAVIDELTRAFRGSGGNVHDLVEWEKTINEAESPVALHAATSRAIELLHSRIDAVGDQYNRGMGKTTDPVQLLSLKARAAMERLQGGGQAAQQTAASQGVDPGALAEARRRGLIK
jgi:hypothetical protein